MAAIRVLFGAKLRHSTTLVRSWCHSAFSSKCLLYTNCAISVSLSMAGDFVQQQVRLLRGASKGKDVARTWRMGCAGLAMGVMCHYWYIWLDRRFVGRTFSVVLKKVVADQIILSPAMWLLTFGLLAVLQNDNLSQFRQRIQTAGAQIYLTEWMVWPPAQAVNFYFLPTKYRVLYDNSVSFLFDWYTSYLIHDCFDQNHVETPQRRNE